MGKMTSKAKKSKKSNPTSPCNHLTQEEFYEIVLDQIKKHDKVHNPKIYLGTWDDDLTIPLECCLLTEPNLQQKIDPSKLEDYIDELGVIFHNNEVFKPVEEMKPGKLSVTYLIVYGETITYTIDCFDYTGISDVPHQLRYDIRDGPGNFAAHNGFLSYKHTKKRSTVSLAGKNPSKVLKNIRRIIETR